MSTITSEKSNRRQPARFTLLGTLKVFGVLEILGVAALAFSLLLVFQSDPPQKTLDEPRSDLQRLLDSASPIRISSALPPIPHTVEAAESHKYAVVDRIEEERWAVLLLNNEIANLTEDHRVEVVVPWESLPVGAAAGDWLRITDSVNETTSERDASTVVTAVLWGKSLEFKFSIDQGQTIEAKERIGAKLQTLRSRGRAQ